MFKKVLGLTLSIAMATALVACSATTTTGNSGSVAATEKPAKTTEVAKTETSESATDFPEMKLVFQGQGYNQTEVDSQCLRDMAAEIESATGGKVTVDMNETGALYTQDEALQAVAAGDLDMNADTIGMLGDYAPELRMFMSPYLFKDADHWQRWFDSDAWKVETDKIAEKTGLRILGMWNMGGDMVTLNVDRKVTKRADLSDLKMRMPNNAAQLFMGEALGGNVIGMAFGDVYMGLQTGAIDGMVSTYAYIKDKSFYEVTKSITVTNHIYGTGYTVINEEKWQSMSPELQKIVGDAVTKCCEGRTQVLKNKASELREFLETDGGMKIYDLTDEEMAAYQKEVNDYVFSSAGDDFRSTWDMDLYNAVEELADK